MASCAKEGDTIWNRKYLLLVLINILNNLSFYLTAASLTLYTKEVLLWNAAAVGLFSGSYAFSALLFRPISGVLADRLGKKKLMSLGSVLVGAAVLGYGLFTSFEVLLVIRIVHGVAYAMTNTAITSAVSLTLPRSKMNEGIGYFGLALIIAQAVAPGIGLDISVNYGYRLVAYIAAGISWISALLLFCYKEQTDAAGAAKGVAMKDLIAKECIALAAIGATLSATNGIFSTYLVLSAASCGLSRTALSPFYWVNGIALVLARLLTGRLGDKKGSGPILWTAFALCGTCTLVMCASRSLLMFCVVGVLKGFGTGIGIPALQAACLKRVERTRSGVASSTYYIGADAGNGLGPIAAGKIVDTCEGYTPAYIFNFIVLCFGAAGFWLFSKKSRRV